MKFFLGFLITFFLTLPAEAAKARIQAPPPSALPVAQIPESVFEQEFTKDFPVRTINRLSVTNLRGAIRITGWNQSKIRVKALVKVSAVGKETADPLFKQADVLFRELWRGYELTASYGKGLSIEQKIQERKNSKIRMDLDIRAPVGLELGVWVTNDPVEVTSWKAKLEVRSKKGPIKVQKIRVPLVVLTCPECSIDLERVTGSIRCVGGSGKTTVQHVYGDSVYVESTTGAIEVGQIRASQSYVSQSGSIQGRRLEGNIEFLTQEGNVEIQEAKGVLSGKTHQGNISAQVLEWDASEKAFLESESGNIRLAVPTTLSANLDMYTPSGKVKLELPFFPEKRSNREVGPQPANHFLGRVGEGGEEIRIFSKSGDIALLGSF